MQFHWGHSNHPTPEPVREFYFFECLFSNLTDDALANPRLNRERMIHFVKCRINALHIRGTEFKSDNFRNCEIDLLQQPKESMKQFIFQNNSINQLITSAKSIELRNAHLKLYHHKNLDNVKISSDNTEIEFSRTVLNRITKDDYKGYWNTYNYLHVNVKSLNSERIEIEKYIAFFDSRDSWLKKILFEFHRGYTSLILPFLLSAFLLLINFALTHCGLNFKENALATVFYPNDLFKNVIMKDFGFENSFSPIKLLLLVSELLFFYSLFCFGFALKKIYGFKIVK